MGVSARRAAQERSRALPEPVHGVDRRGVDGTVRAVGQALPVRKPLRVLHVLAPDLGAGLEGAVAGAVGADDAHLRLVDVAVGDLGPVRAPGRAVAHEAQRRLWTAGQREGGQDVLRAHHDDRAVRPDVWRGTDVPEGSRGPAGGGNAHELGVGGNLERVAREDDALTVGCPRGLQVRETSRGRVQGPGGAARGRRDDEPAVRVEQGGVEHHHRTVRGQLGLREEEPVRLRQQGPVRPVEVLQDERHHVTLDLDEDDPGLGSTSCARRRAEQGRRDAHESCEQGHAAGGRTARGSPWGARHVGGSSRGRAWPGLRTSR